MMETLPTILIVEDNESDIDLLRRRFSEGRLLNPRCVVRDGEEAIAYLSGGKPFFDRARYPLPGIVLLDLDLPTRDGFEVLDWIRARREFDEMPVIILTGDNRDPSIHRALAAGADSYLIKGHDAEGLLHLLRNAFLGWALVPVPRVPDAGTQPMH